MKTESSTNSGLTMVELVSAVAIFILVLGALTMALNKTIEMWSPKRTNQDEKEAASKILDRLEEDLSYAVSDNGVPFDIGSSTNAPPTFIVASAIATNRLTFLLKFIKSSSPNMPSDVAPALDAVFYTYDQGALFRRVIPLDYKDTNVPEHIGTLLESAELKFTEEIETEALHTKMIDFSIDPLNAPEPMVDPGEFSLLATKIEIKDLSLEIPSIYNRIGAFDEIEAFVLPDQLFFSIKLYGDRDWTKFVDALTTKSAAEFKLIVQNLGVESSRMIQFRTASGMRLK